jgi:hypothetical protein
MGEKNAVVDEDGFDGEQGGFDLGFERREGRSFKNKIEGLRALVRGSR